MMRRRGGKLLASGFALSSLLVVAANSASVMKQDSSWKRYHNQQWGYCVSYPSRWRKGDAFEGAGIFVEAGLKKHSRPTGEIDIGVLPDAPPAGSAEGAALTLVDDLQAHLDGLKKFERAERMEVLEKRRLDLFGSAALLTKDRYYDPLERSTWVDEIVFTHRKNALYRIELECRADQLERFEPVFTRLVGTFQFDCAR